MKNTALAFCLLLLFLQLPSLAQNNNQVEEQLASNLFQKQEYDKAKAAYLNLYQKKSAS